MSNIREYLNTPDEVERVEGEVDEHLSELQELFFEFLESHVDWDDLNEDQLEILDEILELTKDDNEDNVNEVAGRRKRVVRGGKRKKKIDCPKGYKAQGKRCVRQSSQERRTRSRAQKKGARKRRTGQQQSIRKRQRSMRRRM